MCIEVSPFSIHLAIYRFHESNYIERYIVAQVLFEKKWERRLCPDIKAS
jgi:hypothetical protein